MESRFQRIFIFFIYVIILSQVACSQQGVNNVAAPGDDSESEMAARQLRIYRDALQQGSTEDVRIDAAVGLLLKNDVQSRDILLSALKSEENPQARQAVCGALIKSRGLSQTIDSLEVFREPLLNILKSTSQQQAQMASEAMLLFDYSDIADSLMEVINNKELASDVRINGIYALQLRPEPSALRGLIGLLDDSDAEVAKAAEKALQDTFGIPVGTGRDVWSDILRDLQLKSPEEIRKDRLLRQEIKIRQMQAERDRLQKLYLGSLDKLYETLDDAGQTKMILEMISLDMYPVRLWALDKAASQYPNIAEELQGKLLALLADPQRDVRLQAAKAWVNLSKLDPAAALLERLKLEEDPEVKLAMLEALGEACFYAFSQGSDIKLPEGVKLQTLEIATKYLQSESAGDCIIGAEVIRKILELNNLSNNSMKSYLEILSNRYEKSISEDETLRAGLLSVLAHLCGQGGAKAEACALYGSYFTQGLTVRDNGDLRLAAARGISYVDKVKALALFKQNNLIQDENLAVQQVVIDVAGQTGQAEDLDWLLKALAVNGTSEQVWEAVKNICRRQKADFLMKWLPALETAERSTTENVREILEIAEQKAAGEKNEALQTQIQQKILSLLIGQKAWDSAATYLDKIGYDPSESRFSSISYASVLKIFLYSNAADRAVSILQVELEKGDLPETSPLAGVLEDYFLDKTASMDFKLLLLKEIKSTSSGNHPKWSSFVDNLSGQLEDTDSNNIPADKEVPDSKIRLQESAATK